MIRTLFLVAVVSLGLAVACMDAVFTIVGGPFWIDETGTVHVEPALHARPGEHP
jgi:hypothetical protein